MQWHTTPGTAAMTHPVTNIIGWTVWHLALDWMHIVDLGIASHACANIMFDLVFNKLKRMTRAAAVSHIADMLSSMDIEQGTDQSRLLMERIVGSQHRSGEA